MTKKKQETVSRLEMPLVEPATFVLHPDSDNEMKVTIREEGGELQVSVDTNREYTICLQSKDTSIQAEGGYFKVQVFQWDHPISFHVVDGID